MSETIFEKLKLSQGINKLRSVLKRGSRFQSSTQKTLQLQEIDEKGKSIDNPYLAARTEWNFMYNDILKAKQNWQWTALSMIAVNLIFGIFLSRAALESKYHSYITKVDEQGNAVFGGFLENANEKASPQMVNAFIRRYIQNLREVIVDPVAEKQFLTYIYGVSRGETLGFINDFYRSNDPFKRAKNGTVEVQVQTAIQKSPQTWQVEWTEMQRNLDGEIIGKSNYEALITVNQYSITDEKELSVNPLGLYVTRLSWSQQL